MGANIKIEDLADVSRGGWNLHVRCGCGHIGIVDAKLMWRWYCCHMWPTRIHMVRDHLWCWRCKGGRPVKVGITAGSPDAPNRFPKNEAEWARLVRRLRG